MDNACVIGYGVVGKATANLFGIKKYFSLHDSTITLSDAAKCRYCFICLPTPVDEQGSYKTADIEEIIKQIEGYGGSGIYIIRSTVWPGFADKIMDLFGINRVISNPEFLSEATAEHDSKYPPFILLGGEQPDFLEDVAGVYLGRIKSAPVILTDNKTAEMAKLAMNAYFTTKVVFANELYDSCQKLGVNYEKVKEVLESHPFGPKNHFDIWHNGGRGALGRCLWKDTRAYGHYTDLDLIKKVIALNEGLIWEYPKKNKDALNTH